MISFYLSNNWGLLIFFIFFAFFISYFLSKLIDLSKISRLSYLSWWHVTKEGHRYTRGFFTILLPAVYMICVGISFYLNMETYNNKIKRAYLLDNNQFYELALYDYEKGRRNFTKTFTLYKEKIISKELQLEKEYFTNFTNFLLKNCGWDYCLSSMINNLNEISGLYPEYSNLLIKFENKNNELKELVKKRMEEVKKYSKENKSNAKNELEELGEKSGKLLKETKESINNATKPIKDKFNTFMKGFKKGSN